MAEQGYDPIVRAMYAASEWQQAAEQAQKMQAVQAMLARRPVVGANIHEAPQGLRPSYIAEQAIEPVAFGAFEDPISQLAFLGAPSMLRMGKAALEAAATPGPRFGGLASQRGNLGRPPMGPQGEALPGSVVRDEQGNLRRLYHGTPNKFPDFEMAEMSPESLYGPGIYMTADPAVAGGSAEEIARGYMGYASKGYQPDTALWAEQMRDGLRDQLQRHRASLADIQQAARGPGRPAGLQARDAQRIAQQQRQIAETEAGLEQAERDVFQAYREGPHVRPTYADLKKPFDINAPFDATAVNTALEGLPKKDAARIIEGTRLAINQSGAKLTNSTFYEGLIQAFGGKEQANAYLQKLGYDGITHVGGAIMGGEPHQVYIAFSPEQVYPSFNVDALRQSLGGR